MLVGLDQYHNSRDTGLAGAKNDLAEMKTCLGDLGYTVASTLSEDGATKGRIVEGLSSLANRAHPGDSVLFYFSGCGSTIAETEGSSATLVPYDYDPANASKDIPLSFLSHWADGLKGVHVMFVLDTCFVRSELESKGGHQPYNHNPRVIDRKLRDAPKPFSGDAVFLCACSGTGSAYETILDPNNKGYVAGAFTDSLTGTAFQLRNEGLGFSDVFIQIKQQFARRALDRFMIDEAPSLTDPGNQIADGTPFLWGSQKKVGETIIAPMRVSLMPDAANSGSDRSSILRDFYPEQSRLLDLLKSDEEVVKFVPWINGLPDHFISARKKEDGWHFKYGGDVDDDLGTELADHGTEDQRIKSLQTMILAEAYATAIYRLTNGTGPATTDTFLTLKAVYKPYGNMEPILIVNGQGNYRFFYLSFNSDTGLVHVNFPDPSAIPGPNDNVIRGGKRKTLPFHLPKQEPICACDVLRAIVVPDDTAGGPDSGGEDLVGRLRKLYIAIRDKKVAWAKNDQQYAVQAFASSKSRF